MKQDESDRLATIDHANLKERSHRMHRNDDYEMRQTLSLHSSRRWARAQSSTPACEPLRYRRPQTRLQPRKIDDLKAQVL